MSDATKACGDKKARFNKKPEEGDEALQDMLKRFNHKI